MTTKKSVDTPNFLYPTDRQFPFDKVCERIVRELEKRNWRVPGMTVKHDKRKGFTWVSKIQGADFKLWFCRIQAQGPAVGINNIAAISTIVIPKKQLDVFGDEGGPTLLLYVGKNWEQDKDAFIKDVGVNSKPGMYLQYRGACNCKGTDISFVHTHPGKRSPLLVWDNDSGCKYDPKFSQPQFFHTDEIMDEFKKYLENVILPQILQVSITN